MVIEPRGVLDFRQRVFELAREWVGSAQVTTLPDGIEHGVVRTIHDSERLRCAKRHR